MNISSTLFSWRISFLWAKLHHWSTCWQLWLVCVWMSAKWLWSAFSVCTSLSKWLKRFGSFWIWSYGCCISSPLRRSQARLAASYYNSPGTEAREFISEIVFEDTIVCSLSVLTGSSVLVLYWGVRELALLLELVRAQDYAQSQHHAHPHESILPRQPMPTRNGVRNPGLMRPSVGGPQM